MIDKNDDDHDDNHDDDDDNGEDMPLFMCWIDFCVSVPL